MAAKKTATEKIEFTCVRCSFTKMWTQKQWDNHMHKVHGWGKTGLIV